MEECKIDDYIKNAIRYLAAMRVIENIYQDKEELENASQAIVNFLELDIPDKELKKLEEGNYLVSKASENYETVWKFLKNKVIENVHMIKGFKRMDEQIAFEKFERLFCEEIKQKINEYWYVREGECDKI